MDISVKELLSLSDDKKRQLLMPYISKKCISLRFADVNNDEVYDLFISYLDRGNISSDKVLKNTIINYILNEVLKRIVNNKIINNFGVITNNYINKKFHGSALEDLNRLMEFYEEYEVILTTNNYEELVNNPKVNNAIEFVFSKYKKVIDESGFYEITDNNYLIDLFDVYAIKNNITIKDNAYDLNSFLVKEPNETVSTIRCYLNEMGNFPILNHDQEIFLGKRIQDGDEEALDTLIKCNLRLVISVAKSYQRPGVSLMDIIQDGNIGLMIAARRFDYKLGYRFSTYAVYWIKQSIRRELANNGKLIRKPVHLTERINKLSYYQKDFINKNGREPSIEEIADYFHISKKVVDELLYYSLDPVSLNTTVGEDQDSTLEEFIESDGKSPEDTAIDSIIKRDIELLIDGLSEREKDVIKSRFGFDDMEPQTLEEISSRYNVTRERIRQIETKALSRLRVRARKEHLNDYCK